ncbi:MAG: 1,4-dihydroxy-2-naphthoate octaprenyltransferase [Simkaniaceae bacterium]|nr:1,4-dihydroxy-2-naphthoate octaprenyltransferase [Simkaniaceae bacterium]
MTARPRTLVASVAPVFIGSSFAVVNEMFSIMTFVCTFFAACFIQILTNFANDYFDIKNGADTPDRIGPIRGLHKNLISLGEMRFAMGLCISLIALCSSYLIYRGGVPILILAIVSTLLAFFYTAGRFSLSYTGLADLVVLIFFGPIATVTSYWLQTFEISSAVIVSSLAPGCLATVLLAINNIRDVKQDTIANKKTLVVRFGIDFGCAEIVVMLAGAFFVPVWLWLFYPTYSVMISASFVILTAVPMVIDIYTNKKPIEIGKHLMSSSFLLLSYTLIFMFNVFYAHRQI